LQKSDLTKFTGPQEGDYKKQDETTQCRKNSVDGVVAVETCKEARGMKLGFLNCAHKGIRLEKEKRL
jgi:hypothetical protein